MALLSSFHDRLQQMEATRNERLALLQAEKDLQARKSQILASKQANIGSMERRCIMLEMKITSQKFKISALKSEIATLDAKHHDCGQRLRLLKRETKELDELQGKKKEYYDMNVAEMREFGSKTENYLAETRSIVRQLKDEASKVKSRFVEVQGGNGDLKNEAIASAEKKRLELMEERTELVAELEKKYKLRTQLQSQLHSILKTQECG